MSRSSHPVLKALALLAVGLVPGGLAYPLWSQEPPAAEPGADYLFMDPALRAKAVQVLPGRAFGDGERVSYTAFNGRVWELTRFQGRHVAILLPDSWMGPAALSAEQIRSFVDRSDLVYQQFKDWEGVEPAGEGPLNVAVIPETCGWGCGLIGSKGLEIADIAGLNPTLWADIAAGKGVSVLIHEMTHNFDVFWPYLSYLPDHPMPGPISSTSTTSPTPARGRPAPLPRRSPATGSPPRPPTSTTARPPGSAACATAGARRAASPPTTPGGASASAWRSSMARGPRAGS